MDRQRNDVAKWVAHLPDLPHQRRSERTFTQVKTEDDEIEHIEMDEGKALDPHMDEALRIYRSEGWASASSISWLFQKEVPDWLDTDQADWPSVKRILQDLKHREVERQVAQAKREVRAKLFDTESHYSGSESADSHDDPTVRIVCAKDSNLKPCFKSTAHLSAKTNIIKMLVIGSIDVELFSLDEDEIDWKSIPVSLERVEVNGRYIRDISLEEMRVTKLCEKGLGLCTNNDVGDATSAAASRMALCDLYNQKLQSQMAENSLQERTQRLEFKFPAGQRLDQRSGQTPGNLSFEETRGRVICPRKPVKQSMISRAKQVEKFSPKTNSVSMATIGRNSLRDERRDYGTHIGKDGSFHGSDTAKNNGYITHKMKSVSCVEDLAPAQRSLHSGVEDLSGITTDDLLKSAIRGNRSKEKECAEQDFSELSTEALLDGAISSNGSSGKKDFKQYFSEVSTDYLLDDVSSDNDSKDNTDINDFSSGSTDDGLGNAMYCKGSKVNNWKYIGTSLTSRRKHEEQPFRRDNNKALVSSSVQSLDDLLDEALGAEEELARRHTQNSPWPTDSNSKSNPNPDNADGLVELRDFTTQNFTENNTASEDRPDSNINSNDNVQNQNIQYVQLFIQPSRRKRFFNFVKRNVVAFGRRVQSINCCSHPMS